VLAATGVAVGWGGVTGVLVGAVVAVAVDIALTRIEPAATRRRRAAIDAALPYAADLLAACLVAGEPLVRAAEVVGSAVAGPVGTALGSAAGAVRLGAEPAAAFGDALADPSFGPLRRALLRALETGAPLAATVARTADELRNERHAAGEAAAHRVGVLVVLPLGVCFLPAFFVLAVVPMAAGSSVGCSLREAAGGRQHTIHRATNTRAVHSCAATQPGGLPAATGWLSQHRPRARDRVQPKQGAPMSPVETTDARNRWTGSAHVPSCAPPHRLRVAAGVRDAGMTTAEYAVGTLAACGFAGLLLKVLTSDGVAALLRGLVRRALSVGF
jgi:hypothetical protein